MSWLRKAPEPDWESIVLTTCSHSGIAVSLAQARVAAGRIRVSSGNIERAENEIAKIRIAGLRG